MFDKIRENAHKLQNVGSLLILVAYVLLVLQLPYLAWLGCLVATGIIELMLIFICDTTITKYIRALANKKLDTVIMLVSIGVTWWLAGPLAAGFFFIGFLVNHFGEKQA